MVISMKEIIKKYIPQGTLNLYGVVKRNLKKKIYPPAPDEVVHFDLKTIYNGHFNVMYRGIPMLRVPFDYVMYQMIICAVEPDLVIEIGTNFGGTTLYLADLMDTLGHGAIHSIDINSNAPELVRNHPRIKLFGNGWEGYDIREAAGFKKILIIDDASHMYEDVLGALEKFSPLVSPDSYYIVEDGIVNEVGLEEQYHGGPLRAIREFLPTHPEFKTDRSYCDFFGVNATWNVNGYLKKHA